MRVISELQEAQLARDHWQAIADERKLENAQLRKRVEAMERAIKQCVIYTNVEHKGGTRLVLIRDTLGKALREIGG